MNACSRLRIHLRQPVVQHLQPSLAARASSSARTEASAAGMSANPSCNALKYNMVPPTSNGMRPAAVISAMAGSASLLNSAAE